MWWRIQDCYEDDQFWPFWLGTIVVHLLGFGAHLYHV